MGARRPSFRFGRRIGMWLRRRIAAGGGAPASGEWSSGASAVSARTGFASVLPEFSGLACPEQEDLAAIHVEWSAGAGYVTLGAPLYLECALAGSFDGTSLTGAGAAGGIDIEVTGTVTAGELTGTVTITNGSHEEVRSFVAPSGGSPEAIAADYWVDSANGNDANTGASPDQAFATIDGLPALAAGDVIHLARGSRWRELLLGPTGSTGITVRAYGVGPRPILDAFISTLAAGWTKTGGRTNIYQYSMPVENSGGSAYTVCALENRASGRQGFQLRPVADQATCDTTPGSYVAVNPSAGGTITFYVHLTTSVAPTDNRVELTARPHGCHVFGSSVLKGLMLRGGWHTSGGLYCEASAAAIDLPDVDDCISLHGTDHNIYMCGNDASRSMTVGACGGANSVTMWVFHRNTIDASAEMAMIDCGALNFVDVDAAIPLISQKPGAFNSHSTTGFWAVQTLSQCGSARTGPWSIRTGLVDECLFEQLRVNSAGFIGSLTAANTLTVSNTRIYGLTTGGNGQCIQYGGTLTVSNCLLVRTGDTVTGGLIQAGGTAAVSNTMFVAGGASAIDDNPSSALACTSSRCVYYNNGARFATASSAFTPSNNNVALTTGTWRENSGASQRAWSTYSVTNAYGNEAASGSTLPSVEVEADATRPVYMETAASLAARGWDVGPVQCKPGSGTSWVTPSTYDAWKVFLDLL